MARKPSLTTLIRDAPRAPGAAPSAAPGAAPSAAPRVRRRSKDRTISNAITINLKHSKNAAEIVRSVAGAFGWRETVTLAEDCNANVFWYERAITVGEVRHLNEHQRVNMIPGMHEMARKASLARALNRLRTLSPDEFAFNPRTWTLPAQLGEFRQLCRLSCWRFRAGCPTLFLS